MGKLMMAAMMTVLAGCGLGALPEQADAKLTPESMAAIPEVPYERVSLQAQPLAPGKDPVFLARARQQFVKQQVLHDHVSATVNVAGVLGAEGKTLKAIVGQAGCGFATMGIGSATVSNGVAHVTLSGIPSDTQLDLVLSMDSDGNGECTEADSMWMGQLVTTQSNVTVSVDLTALEASPNWMCFAMNEAPAP
jgi:hypothetical protein